MADEKPADTLRQLTVFARVTAMVRDRDAVELHRGGVTSLSGAVITGGTDQLGLGEPTRPSIPW